MQVLNSLNIANTARVVFYWYKPYAMLTQSNHLHSLDWPQIVAFPVSRTTNPVVSQKLLFYIQRVTLSYTQHCCPPYVATSCAKVGEACFVFTPNRIHCLSQQEWNCFPSLTATEFKLYTSISHKKELQSTATNKISSKKHDSHVSADESVARLTHLNLLPPPHYRHHYYLSTV